MTVRSDTCYYTRSSSHTSNAILMTCSRTANGNRNSKRSRDEPEPTKLTTSRLIRRVRGNNRVRSRRHHAVKLVPLQGDSAAIVSRTRASDGQYSVTLKCTRPTVVDGVLVFVVLSKRAPAWSDDGVVVFIPNYVLERGLREGTKLCVWPRLPSCLSNGVLVNKPSTQPGWYKGDSSSILKLVISISKYLNCNIRIFTRIFISHHFSIDVVDIFEIF